MARSQETFNKKEAEKKKAKKRQEKEQKKEDRKANAKDSDNEFVLAYVDENGNISNTPPDPRRMIKVREEDIQLSVPKHDAIIQGAVRNGIVTFFNDSKGYGFIKDTTTQESIFVHLNGLIDQIKENNKVSFETEMGPKGLNAIQVKLVK
jgi:cold shock CspA family protein